MKKNTRKNKSIIQARLRRATLRFSFYLSCLLLFVFLLQSGQTRSYFSASLDLPAASFTTGYWVPSISYSLDPTNPDGEDNHYSEPPCLILTSDLEEAEIHYAFFGTAINEGVATADNCLYPPLGRSLFSAYAVNPGNPDWKSEELELEFSIGPETFVPASIIINEIMWGGSSAHQQDEWIELYNRSYLPIDLSGWRIISAAAGFKDLLLPTGSIIEAQSYFVISSQEDSKKSARLYPADYNDKNLRLHDTRQGNLRLLSKDGNLIDQALAWPDWPAGESGPDHFISMARHSQPGTGLEKTDWYSAYRSDMDFSAYWKSDGLDYGTPGQANLAPELSETEDEDENSENKKAQPVIERFNDIDNEENDNKNKNNQDGSCTDDCAAEESPDTAPAIINETDSSDNPDTPEAQAPITDLPSEAPIPTDQDLETDNNEPVIGEKAETPDEIPTENLAPEKEEKVPENQAEKAESESTTPPEKEE
jgi:hypothetical protein